MYFHFSEEYIDEVLAKVDMMQLMEKYGVRVKPGQGKNHYFVASFCCGKKDFDNGRIRKETQTYRCLACGDGGNAIHFLRNVIGKSFHEAVTELAEMAGMELPAEDPKLLEEKKRKAYALQLTANFYHEQNNFEYFLSRGISMEVLKKHKAGYAPGGRTLRNFLESKGFTKEELRHFKLINHKGLDTFFYRAVLPIYRNGKIIDLYGRAVDDTKTGVKHLYLYGDDILGGFDLIRPEGVVKVFESAIDRLVAESHGIDNGIDSGGAKKFLPEHARLLKKKGVDKVLMVYDGDQAGRDGSIEAGELLINEGIQTWIAELPEGKDPADILLNEGKDSFIHYISGSKTYQQIRMFRELSKYRLEEIEEYIIHMKHMKREAAAAATTN